MAVILQPVKTYLFFPLNEIKQLTLFSVFQHNEYVATRVNELKVLDDMWMVKPTQYFDFSLDLFKDSLHLNLSLIQNLDRYLVISDLIHRHYRRNKQLRYCQKCA